MTLLDSVTLRQVADALEAIPTAGGDAWHATRAAVIKAITPLGEDHPVLDIPAALRQVRTADERWWLSAAALKLRQEADELDDALENAAAEVESARKNDWRVV